MRLGRKRSQDKGDKQVTAGDNRGPCLGIVENGTSEWRGSGIESTQENDELAIFS